MDTVEDRDEADALADRILALLNESTSDRRVIRSALWCAILDGANDLAVEALKAMGAERDEAREVKMTFAIVHNQLMDLTVDTLLGLKSEREQSHG